MHASSEESLQKYSKGGKMSGGVYTDDQDHWDFMAEVMKSQITSNPLHIFEFPQIT